MKLTTRLSRKDKTIKELLKPNHTLTGPIRNWDGIVGSELYYGQSYDDEPEWKNFLENGTDQTLSTLKNQGAAAVLFVPIKEESKFLIYLFGYGLLSLNDGATEWGFGIKVVLNSIELNGLKSVDSKKLNHTGKNSRVQLGTKGGIEEFDVDIMQDLVSHISAYSIDTNFAKSLTGGESLIMSTDLTGSSIIKKSNEIIKQYKLNKYQRDFKWIDHISPVKDQQLKIQLNNSVLNELNQIISGAPNDDITFSFPEIIDYGNFDFLKYKGYPNSNEFSHLEISDFITDYISNSGVPLTIKDLETFQVDLYNGSGNVYKYYYLFKCINIEVSLSSKLYILANGQWFELEKNYLDMVTKFFDGLLASPLEFKGTETTFETNEVTYLTQTFPNQEILDRNLFRVYGQKNAIEYGDLITPKREIIHIKDGKSSSKLSHLFNQGLVCAKLLVNDNQFLNAFTNVIVDPAIKTAFNPSTFDSKKITIVYRVLKTGSSLTLPFFSKIILYDSYTKIKSMRYKFRLEWVKYL